MSVQVAPPASAGVAVIRVVALLLFLPLAGCLADDMGDASDRPVPGLQDAPSWQVGDWWTYHVLHRATGYEADVTVVVAGSEDGMALIGSPDGGSFHWMLITHLPFHATVDPTDLSWPAHERRFAPVRFPLQEGQTWTTRWMSGGDLTAQVTSVEGAQARIDVQGDWDIQIQYDGVLGAITHMDVAGYAAMDLIDHGREYHGEVVVPMDHTLIWYPGRALGVLDYEGQPAAPLHTEVMPDGYDEITFALMAGTRDRTGTGIEVTAGVFMARAQAPDGTTWSVDGTGVGVGRPLEVFHHPAVPGTWQMTFLAGGNGVAAMEAFAYDRLVVDLP